MNYSRNGNTDISIYFPLKSFSSIYDVVRFSLSIPITKLTVNPKVSHYERDQNDEMILEVYTK